MIRYVLVAVLTVALLALSIPAIDYAATENTDRQVVGEIDSVEAAATSLIENEEIPPDGQQRPLRTLELSLPGDSFTTQSVDTLEIERVDENVSRVTYVVEGQSRAQKVIDAPIVYENPYENRTVEVGGSGDTELDLILAEDRNGVPVIVATRDGELEGEPPEPASFDVSIVETNAPIDEGETINADVHVVNSGDETDTQTVDLEVDGLGTDAEKLELGPGEETTVTLGVGTESGYADTDTESVDCFEEYDSIFDIIRCFINDETETSARWVPSDDVGTHEATVTSDNTIDETNVTVRVRSS